MKLLTYITIFLTALALDLALIYSAKADDVISLDLVDLTYQRFDADGVEPMITYDGLGRKLGSALGLQLNTTVFSYLYANFNVSSMRDYYPEGDYGQYRTIGLQARLGARLTEWMDIGYYHYSRHLMDTPEPNDQSYQQTNALEITIHLYNNHKTHSPLW